MALEDPTPEVREEEILNGSDIEPATRLEYFMKKAANEVPKPAEIDGGKELVVNSAGTGYVLVDPIFKSLADGAANTIGRGEGLDPSATNKGAFASGNRCTASGFDSFAMGRASTASGDVSAVIGIECEATGFPSLAEGYDTSATGTGSHSEGLKTTASGTYSHAENRETTASGANSHSSGRGTIANKSNHFVIGKYNVPDPGEANTGLYVFIIGNGADADHRSNALTVDWLGNIVCNNIPAPPSAAGSYALSCTVDASGNASYAWV